MDFAWYDFLLIVVGLGIAVGGAVWEEVIFSILGAIVLVMGPLHANARSEDNGKLASGATSALVSQGYPRPATIDGGSRTGRWSVGDCQLKFKLKKSDGKWIALVAHDNGSVSVPVTRQVKNLLSNPICS